MCVAQVVIGPTPRRLGERIFVVAEACFDVLSHVWNSTASVQEWLDSGERPFTEQEVIVVAIDAEHVLPVPSVPVRT